MWMIPGVSMNPWPGPYVDFTHSLSMTWCVNVPDVTTTYPGPGCLCHPLDALAWMVICGITTSVRFSESILKSLLEKRKSSTVACTGVAGASAEVAAATPTEPLCVCKRDCDTPCHRQRGHHAACCDCAPAHVLTSFLPRGVNGRPVP
jgi:hypothetical protein